MSTPPLAAALRDLLGPRRSNTAAAQVTTALHSIARRVAPKADHEDLVQRILIKLLDKPEPVLGANNPEAYVTRMIRNLDIDTRRSARVRAAATAVIPEHADATQEDEAEDAEIGRLLARVCEIAISRRPASYQKQRTIDVAQVFDLAAGKVTMRQLIDAEGPAEGDRKKVQNRLFKRHERTRGDLRDALEELESQGDVTAEEAGALQRRLQLLLRCQPSRAKNVERGR